MTIDHAALSRVVSEVQQSEGLVLLLTGAGISAESGIPTFRGEEGYWVVGSRNYHPQEMATFSMFERMPSEVWAWYLYRWGVCRAADPNPAHHAAVALEQKLGERFLLVTQNVDGLHLRAGNSAARTYQIHGNIDFMRCSRECSYQLYPLPEEVAAKQKGEKLSTSEEAALVCPACGAPSRPHVLWFDESYDEERFRFASSIDAARCCRLLVTIGSSGTTNLPAQIASIAARGGATLIDINPDDNPFADLAENSGGLVLRGAAGDCLPELVELF